MVSLVDEFVSNFDGQPEVEVEDARLTDVFKLCTSLADFGLLKPRSVAIQSRTWLPSEDGEGSLANFAFAAEFRARHPDVGVIAETGLAEDWKICFLPTLLVYASTNALAFFAHFTRLIKLQ